LLAGFGVGEKYTGFGVEGDDHMWLCGREAGLGHGEILEAIWLALACMFSGILHPLANPDTLKTLPMCNFEKNCQWKQPLVQNTLET